MIMRSIMYRHRRLTEQDILLDKGQRATNPETEFMEARTKVARFVQLFVEVRLLEAIAVVDQFTRWRLALPRLSERRLE